jgi:hypothetical protein
MSIDLARLLSLYPATTSALANKRIKLVRHAMRKPIWEGFNKILRFNKEILRSFTSEQGNDIFKEIDLILVFVPVSGGRALLAGAFWNKGQCESSVVTDSDGHRQFLAYRKSKGHPDVRPADLIYYNLIPCEELSELYDRVIIDWGGATISWHQKRLDKGIDQILPKGFVSEFPGWDKVLLTHQELCAVIGNDTFPYGRHGNPSWTNFLTSHDGVYLITDTKTGQQYVGSAYGDEGIWGRWNGYVRTGHNYNNRLLALIEKEGIEHCHHFVYSLHGVFPKGSMTQPALIGVESMLKEKLGSRAYGFNAN